MQLTHRLLALAAHLHLLVLAGKHFGDRIGELLTILNTKMWMKVQLVHRGELFREIQEFRCREIERKTKETWVTMLGKQPDGPKKRLAKGNKWLAPEFVTTESDLYYDVQMCARPSPTSVVCSLPIQKTNKSPAKLSVEAFGPENAIHEGPRRATQGIGVPEAENSTLVDSRRNNGLGSLWL
ncbi:hypothetical protein C8R43DRAFT_960901 [Mycena crocata]|nr:hypothetical protein C8R43DRAFT_960901 [Mycena crocata]